MTTADQPVALRVTEVFGPTLQGEGPATGHAAAFVRLAGCPVGCSWCDTAYSWDPARELRPATVTATDVVAADADRRAGPDGIVVVTGGEPLAQQPGLLRLVREPALAHRRLHLETAGVHRPAPGLLAGFETVVVSPKLDNSGVPEHRRIRHEALALIFRDLAGCGAPAALGAVGG